MIFFCLVIKEVSMEYHVSKNGLNENNGTESSPFLTIQKAADVAQPGDKIIVHEGIYREWVKPKRAGTKNARIIYEAKENEKVVIKGSEQINTWELIEKNMWKVVLPNSFFGEFNPFAQEVSGDWLEQPKNPPVHLGEVFLNGKSFYEVATVDEVKNPTPKTECKIWTWDEGRNRNITDVEQTCFVWHSEVETEQTTIYANFQGVNPNNECVEINVRKCCFFPERTGIDFITVRGFEMEQAACPWAPPTSKQFGLLGTNWSKGWIIENNIVHNAKCSGISLGKEETTGHNDFSNKKIKPGYQYQMEAVFKARHIGWDKERIGSHIVRNNKIYDCGQNGIVGHLGCVFSQIYGNEIFNIATKFEFFGYEIAGIKLHAAIDVQIKNNYIHNCTLGTWLDWEAQGTRVSCNIYDENLRDFMIEVSHGPCLIDNNIFTSEYALNNGAQGNAFVHNLWCGYVEKYPVIDRTTPYHLPHSTEILGTAFIYGNDDRWLNNIFCKKGECEKFPYGTNCYDGCPTSFDEYLARIEKVEGDHQRYFAVSQSAYVDGNAYFGGTEKFCDEKKYFVAEKNLEPKIVREPDGIYFEINIPEDFINSSVFKNEIVECNNLELPRLSQQRFENPDETDIVLDFDLVNEKRKLYAVAGPIQNLKSGFNKIKIW